MDSDKNNNQKYHNPPLGISFASAKLYAWTFVSEKLTKARLPLLDC